MQTFNILISHCSRARRFEPHSVGDPEYRFSRDEGQNSNCIWVFKFRFYHEKQYTPISEY